MINEHDNECVLQSTSVDQYSIMNRGSLSLRQEDTNGGLSIDENRLSDVLDGGHHFDDTDYEYRYNRSRGLFQKDNNNTREYLFNKI